MVAYNIRYLDKNNIRLHQEAIYMRGVSGAKQSATALSPLNTESIEIRDVLNNIVAKKQKGKWVDLDKKSIVRHSFDVCYLNANRELIHKESEVETRGLHAMKIASVKIAPEETAYIEIRATGTDTVLATRRGNLWIASETYF